MNMSARTTGLLTLLAMLAFAANSVLCRLALGQGAIDAASFAALRTFSGALVLLLLALPGWRQHGRTAVDWRTGVCLFLYMTFFSFAYLSLGAATGALILFSAVQMTMFCAAIKAGERFSRLSWLGLLFALAGLIYLVMPGLTAPDPVGAALMMIAGVAWGLYSLLGKRARNPLEATANNFLLCLPLALLVSLLFRDQWHVSSAGVVLAISSGGLASALGYVIWYAALKGLSASRAATVQLSVPAIAAFAGAVFLAESITLRLILASVATLGGIALVLTQRSSHLPAER